MMQLLIKISKEENYLMCLILHKLCDPQAASFPKDSTFTLDPLWYYFLLLKGLENRYIIDYHCQAINICFIFSKM